MESTFTRCIAAGALMLTALFSYSQTSWQITGNSNTTNANFVGTTVKQPLTFRTNNIERMRIGANGNVGIGTKTPENTLHVFKGSAGTVTGFSNSPIIVENSTNAYINILAPDASETGILFGKPQSNVSGGIIYNNTSTPNGLQFRTGGNGTRVVITSTGLFGVNTVSPVVEAHIVHGFGSVTHGLRIHHVSAVGNHYWNLYTQSGGVLELAADGNIRGTFDPTSGVYTASSDARRKKDIELAPDVLTKVLQLQVKKYHFLENKSSDKKYYGLIAQEVEKLFPEIVYHNKIDGGGDYYTMDYSGFGVLAIKAIQEQQKKIDVQQQEITDLKARIEKLETTLASLASDKASPAATNLKEGISSNIKNAALEQNQPNPFNQTTIIRYRLPQGAKGQINIYNSNGMLVKTITANEAGETRINANELSAGTYTYALIMNDRSVASKKLVLTK